MRTTSTCSASKAGTRTSAALLTALTASLLVLTHCAGGGVPVTEVPADGSLVAVRSWLVAGPLPSPDIVDAGPDGPKRAGYDLDFLGALGGESGARVTPGTAINVGDTASVEFFAHEWHGTYADLTDILGRQARVCAYLYAEIESDVDREIYLHMGTNDAGKVWLGGELVLAHPGDRGAERAQDVTVVQLKAGRTPVLMKIDQAGGGWGAYFELCEQEAHQDYVKSSFPRRFDIEADDELPRVGDTVRVEISNVPSWDGLDVPITWQLVDGEHTTTLSGSEPGNSFVVSDGPTRSLVVLARADHPQNGEVLGRESIFASSTEKDFFSPTNRPDHVVLSLGDNAGVDRRVAWRTDETVTGSAAQYVEMPDGDPSEADWRGSDIGRVTGTSVAHESTLGPCRMHDVTITGLTPGRRYSYRIGSGADDDWSDPLEFTVADKSADTISICVQGDTRTNYDIWHQVMAATVEWDPAFIVNVGDIVATGRNMDHWNRWFFEAKDLLPSYPYMTTPGNHEGQAEEYFHAFALPTNAGADSVLEQWYSFDWGPTHWVSLNSCTMIEEQTAWLEQDLAANDKPWVLVYFHHPAYAGHSSRGDGNARIRDAWSPIFDKYGVDIAWQGHDHYYFRTKAIRGGQVVEDGAGTIYLTTGGGGAGIYEPIENQWAAVLEKSHHFVHVEIVGNILAAKAYRIDGSLLDEFTIVK